MPRCPEAAARLLAGAEPDHHGACGHDARKQAERDGDARGQHDRRAQLCRCEPPLRGLRHRRLAPSSVACDVTLSQPPLTTKGVPTRKLIPGVIAGGLAWTLMEAFGGYLVHHFLRSDSVYGVFATCSGWWHGSISACR